MKIICTLPNASAEISGIKFVSCDGGMLSEEISDEQGARLLSIPGYVAQVAKTDPTGGAPALNEDQKEAAMSALYERAAKIGFTIKKSWGLDLLTLKVEEAEAALTGGSK